MLNDHLSTALPRSSVGTKYESGNSISAGCKMIYYATTIESSMMTASRCSNYYDNLGVKPEAALERWLTSRYWDFMNCWPLLT